MSLVNLVVSKACAQRLCFCSGGLSKPRPVHDEKRYRINVLNTLMSRHHYRNILLAAGHLVRLELD